MGSKGASGARRRPVGAFLGAVVVAAGLLLVALAGPARAVEPSAAASGDPATTQPSTRGDDSPLTVTGGDLVGVLVIGAVAAAVATVLLAARRRAAT